jgi:hypothetical protein
MNCGPVFCSSTVIDVGMYWLPTCTPPMGINRDRHVILGLTQFSCISLVSCAQVDELARCFTMHALHDKI